MAHSVKTVVIVRTLIAGAVPQIDLDCAAGLPKVNILRIIVKNINLCPQRIPDPLQRMVLIRLITIGFQKAYHLFIVADPDRPQPILRPMLACV